MQRSQRAVAKQLFQARALEDAVRSAQGQRRAGDPGDGFADHVFCAVESSGGFRDYRSKGGRIRAERLSPERRREIAAKAGRASWADLPQATHDGVLRIGDAEIACAVLETRQRVLTQSGVMRAIGRARQAKGRQYYDGDVNLPAFLTAKNLKPFIPSELYVTSSQIEFRTRRGNKAFGYPGELLPKVCTVFDEADAANALTPAQRHIALKARMLLRGLAQVGIVALVDEATGFQEDREKDELHRLLAIYLSEERLQWAKRFPDEFYKQIYRLKGWRWPAGVKRTPLVGQITNSLVYDKLPPGVLAELRDRNPVIEETKRRRWKHHQFLSEDIGQPDLRDHLLQIIAIMRGARSWGEFAQSFERAFPGPQGILDLSAA